MRSLSARLSAVLVSVLLPVSSLVAPTASSAQTTPSQTTGSQENQPVETPSGWIVYSQDTEPNAADVDVLEGEDIAPGASFLAPPVDAPAEAWLEITPLGLEGQAKIWSLDTAEETPTEETPSSTDSGTESPVPQEESAAREESSLPILGPGATDPDLPEGPAMVCAGAPSMASGCQRTFIYRSLQRRGEAAQNLEITADFAQGLAVVGRYKMDGLPIEGARISILPADLESSRPFTMPLALEPGSGRLRREVETDGDGFFRLPPLRAGVYRLEALLPTGRVHRPDIFELPAFPDAQQEVGSVAEDDAVVWDLGELEVADWLAVEVRVVDQDGVPIDGATVEARQGRSASELVSFRGRSDDEGQLRLSGFDVEQEMRVDCAAPGYRPWGAEYELLPVEVICRLEKLARIQGRLLDLQGQAPTGAQISALASAANGDDAEPPAGDAGRVSIPDGEGRFLLEVAPGELVLTAAAPGFFADQRTLRLAAGEELDLGEITLLPGRELIGRVIEAPPPPDGPPPLIQEEPQDRAIPNAEVQAIDPPGAAWAISGADGFFTLAAIGDATLHLEVRAEGFAAKRLHLDRAAQRQDEPFHVELERGGWIRALVGSGGEPCAGCLLRLEPSGLEMRTDGDGEALTPPLSPGVYRLERPEIMTFGSGVVEIPGAMAKTTRVIADEISTVRFELEPERLAVRFEPEPEGYWWMIARTAFGEERLEPDADGLFHPPRPDGAAQNLFLTRFDEASGHDLEVLITTLEPSFRSPEDEPLVLELPAGEMTGRVQKKVGFARPGPSPVSNPDALQEAVRVRLQRVADGAHAAELWSDGEGRFHLPHIPPGVYSLVLGERAFQFVSIGESSSLDLGDFQLVEGGF